LAVTATNSRLGAVAPYTISSRKQAEILAFQISANGTSGVTFASGSRPLSLVVDRSGTPCDARGQIGTVSH